MSRVLKKYEIRPSKRLGQNFLIDKFAVKKIISAAELSKKDVVLEIGPGTGILTRELAKKAGKVVAVEKDVRMIEILKKELGDFKNIVVLHQDILHLGNKLPNGFKVVGNLPFYLTAPVIRRFLEFDEARPRCMVLVVQKEVAQRICAKSPKMNLLAVSVQFYAEPKIVSYISKTSFWPKPKVDSAIIKITPQVNKYTPDELFTRRFFGIVRAGFSQPRKQLANNLSKGLKLDKKLVKDLLLKNGVSPKRRAETLTMKDCICLAKILQFKNVNDVEK